MMTRIGSTAQRLIDKPYEKRVCRWENYPHCQMPGYDGTDASIEEYVAFIHELGLEVQVVQGTSGYGDPRFKSKLLPSDPTVEHDRLGKFLESAHQREVIVLSYYGMTANPLLAKQHPEWLMKYLDDGRPAPVGDYWFCMNSPYRDWLAEYLKETLENLDLDGFYFDGTNWGSHGSPGEPPYFVACCCEYCRKLFAQDTGLEIPTRVDPESIPFRQFLGWRCDTLRQFMAHLTRKVRTAYPAAILDFNHYPGVYNIWALGHPVNPLRVAESGGYFFMERTIYDGTSLCAKYGRAHGSPFGVFFGPTQSMNECASHTAPYPESLSITVHCLSAMANGGRPILAMMRDPSLLNQECISSVFRELKKRVEYMDGETVKYLAMHWSGQSRDSHRPSTDHYSSAIAYFKTIQGTYEILNQSHLLLDVVCDEHLTDTYLSPYKVLFLSDSACLSDKQCDVIRRFVANGGTLLATHETSLRDEWGRKRNDFQLADVLGITYRGSVQDGATQGIIYVPRDQDLRRRYGLVACFEAAETNVSIPSSANTEILLAKSSLTGHRPLDKFDPRANYDSGEPGVTLHHFGRGRAFYIGGNIGQGFACNPYPPLKRWVADLVRRTVPPIEVEAPKAIEVTAVLQGDGRLLVHLINNPTPFIAHSMSPENAREVCTYFYNLEEINPIYDVRIRLNAIKAKSASMPLQNRLLEVTGCPPTITVPLVAVHEVVVVET